MLNIPMVSVESSVNSVQAEMDESKSLHES